MSHYWKYQFDHWECQKCHVTSFNDACNKPLDDQTIDVIDQFVMVSVGCEKLSTVLKQHEFEGIMNQMSSINQLTEEDILNAWRCVQIKRVLED